MHNFQPKIILDAARGVTRQLRPHQRVSTRRRVWTGLMLAGDGWSAHTAVSVERLQQVGEQAVRVPDDFRMYPKLDFIHLKGL